MKTETIMRLLVLACVCLGQSGFSAVTLSTDFADAQNQRDPLYTFWKVRNEIPPYPTVGPQQPPQENAMNCIRLLGGWESNGAMNLAEDVVTWDEGLQDYVYHWDILTNRINGEMSFTDSALPADTFFAIEVTKP